MRLGRDSDLHEALEVRAHLPQSLVLHLGKERRVVFLARVAACSAIALDAETLSNLVKVKALLEMSQVALTRNDTPIALISPTLLRLVKISELLKLINVVQRYCIRVRLLSHRQHIVAPRTVRAST